jgi:hypothetical protein
VREKDLFFSFSHKEIRATNRVCAAGLFFSFQEQERELAFGDFDQNEKR